MNYDFALKDGMAVLFLDILGFSNLVVHYKDFCFDDGKPHGLTLKYENVYKQIIERYETLTKDGKSSFIWFSDTIILTTGIENANSLVKELTYLQNSFLSCGVALRGCICTGKLYCGNNNMWGESIIRANHIEKDIADYPRVIIPQGDYEKLPLQPYSKYFSTLNINDSGYMEFSFFDMKLDELLKSKPEFHDVTVSTLLTYIKEIEQNYFTASLKVKYKWEWLASRLLAAIKFRKDILCSLTKDYELEKVSYDSLIKRLECIAHPILTNKQISYT